jgi:hypothetical protein
MLDSTNCTEHESELYCKNCHGRKYGPKGYGKLPQTDKKSFIFLKLTFSFVCSSFQASVVVPVAYQWTRVPNSQPHPSKYSQNSFQIFCFTSLVVSPLVLYIYPRLYPFSKVLNTSQATPEYPVSIHSLVHLVPYKFCKIFLPLNLHQKMTKIKISHIRKI